MLEFDWKRHGLILGAVFAVGAGVVAILHHGYSPNHGKHIPISASAAKLIGDRIGVDWNRVPLEQFRRGLEVEQEHWQTVGGNMEKIAEIAIAHIAGDFGIDPDEKGLRDYYDRLDVMEASAESGMDPDYDRLDEESLAEVGPLRSDDPQWGVLIRKARSRLGLSQEEWAQQLGVRGRSISRWEKGEVLPRHGVRRKILESVLPEDSMNLREAFHSMGVAD